MNSTRITPLRTDRSQLQRQSAIQSLVSEESLPSIIRTQRRGTSQAHQSATLQKPSVRRGKLQPKGQQTGSRRPLRPRARLKPLAIRSVAGGLRVEAETLTLSRGYRNESTPLASAGKLISLRGGGKTEKGTAAGIFSGSTGRYDVIIGYFDENDGAARLSAHIDGKPSGAIALNQQLGSNNVSAANFVRRAIATNVSLKKGATFELLGQEQGEEHARVDYIQFVPVGSSVIKTAAVPPSRPYRYVAPSVRGDGSGSSWDNAAGLWALPQLVRQLSETGGEVLIAGNLGDYQANSAITLDAGGTSETPVIIRGASTDGSEGVRPKFVGSRVYPYAATGNPGNSLFRLASGASNLEFRDLDFANLGNGCFVFVGTAGNVKIEDAQVKNVRRFIEHESTNGNFAVSNVEIRDVQINGFSKGAIRFGKSQADGGADASNIVIEDVIGDSERQDFDNFSMGIHLRGDVQNVTIRRTRMDNSQQTLSDDRYWNGDGFATEGGVRNVLFEDTSASGHTDGGYDLKSTNTVMIRPIARDNKRNYRLWSDTLIQGGIGESPQTRGGIGNQTQIYVNSQAKVTLENCLFRDESPNTTVFTSEDEGVIVVRGGSVQHEGELQRVEGGQVIFENVAIE